MAENESLDLGRTTRWRRVLQSFERNDPVVETVYAARRALCQTVKSVREQIPLDDLIEAACGDRSRLSELIRQCQQGRQHAELIKRSVRPDMDRLTAYAVYLEAIGDRFFDQIAVAAPCPNKGLTAHDVQVRRVEVENQLRSEIDRLAKRINDDPACRIRVPPRKGTATDETKELLNFSLVDPSRRRGA
jgi:hypothetical protein